LDDVLWATRLQIALMLKVRVVLLLPEDGVLTVKAGIRRKTSSTRRIWRPRNWAWGNDRAPAAARTRCPAAKRFFLPMRTGRGLIGAIGIDSDKTGPLLTPDEAPVCWTAVDSGRAGDRAGAAGRGHGQASSVPSNPNGCARRC